MKLLRPSVSITFCASIFLGVIFGGESRAADDRPNIVYILSDDQSWTDYGFMGHEAIETPHLDALAARSAVFPRGYVPTALCRPSLATLATGLFTHQHKISGNDPSPTLAPNDSPEGAALRERMIAHTDGLPTLPRLLGEAGYLSHQSGKWWEGSWERGGFTHGMTRGFPERGGRHGDDGLKIGRDGMEPVFGFIDHAVGEEKPFFLWYAPFLPHTPHNPPKRLMDKYTAQDPERPMEVSRYYAMCEWFDETCGELIDYLEEKGQADNTIIFYLSDNGWIQNFPGNPDGGQLKGGGYAPRSKQSPNEGGVRQPILVSWPGQIEPGERPELVSSIDFYPSALAAAGIEVPEGRPGLNLLPLVKDGTPLGRDHIFGESCSHDVADVDDPNASLLYRWVIRDEWKLLLTYDGIINRYKTTHPRTERRPQLFDLSEDPHENTNLAKDNPEVVAELATLIREWYPVGDRKTIEVWEGE